ncbi:MAG: hypothetical protein Kow0069_30200 [Promethearchaeota archaeon]
MLVDLRVARLTALVVGGGSAAAKKVRALVDGGCHDVKVLAPSFCEDLEKMAKNERRVELVNGVVDPSEPEAFQSYLMGRQLVVAATSDKALNRSIVKCARGLGATCAVVDDPAACDFFFVASTKVGRFELGVSSGGIAPGLAAVARDHLEASFPRWLVAAAEVAAAIRPRVKEKFSTAARRAAVLKVIFADATVVSLLEEGNIERATSEAVNLMEREECS